MVARSGMEDTAQLLRGQRAWEWRVAAAGLDELDARVDVGDLVVEPQPAREAAQGGELLGDRRALRPRPAGRRIDGLQVALVVQDRRERQRVGPRWRPSSDCTYSAKDRSVERYVCAACAAAYCSAAGNSQRPAPNGPCPAARPAPVAGSSALACPSCVPGALTY
jgi:hypothetical protein